MAYREMERTVRDYKKLEEVGDSLEGYYRGQKEAITKYGNATFLSLDTEEGEVILIANANLLQYNWDNLLNKAVKIEFEGYEKNPKTGRFYKTYKVFVNDDEEEIPF